MHHCVRHDQTLHPLYISNDTKLCEPKVFMIYILYWFVFSPLQHQLPYVKAAPLSLVSIWSSGSSQSSQKLSRRSGDWGDCLFPYDRLDRFKDWRRAAGSDVPGSDNRILARYSQTKWRTSIAERISSIVIFLFFRFCAVVELEESYEDTDFGFDRYIRSEKN